MRLWIRAGLAAALLVGLTAVPASGATLSMWLATDYGFDDPSTAAALGAGVPLLPDSTFFANPDPGSPSLIDITTPSPIPGTSIVGATKANPSNGTSTWTVTALDRAYDDLWIVIQGHEPGDSYYTDNTLIGLTIDPADPRWAVVHPTGASSVSYLAYFIGDLAQGASFDVPISYIVAQALKVVSTDPVVCEFPQFRVNFLELAVVPEPLVTSLLAFGGILLATRRRHTR